MSSTSDAVVNETLNMTLDIADSCSQQYISVTYDLAIANRAYRIQNENSPKFDRIFIHVGGFHTELSYYKAIGKYIQESGIPSLIEECGVLAHGSMNGFLTGHNYNRCKRIHPIVSTALKIIHFKEFWKTYSRADSNISEDELFDLLQMDNEKNDMPSELETILKAYDDFYKETLIGDHGFTAKYYLQYVYFIDLLNLLERGIRTCDVDLYEYAIFHMIPVLFSFNHQNYSRYLTLYRYKLSNIEKTHPGLKDQLENGSFAIRRTQKNFARSAIDLTLEQTINASAANRLSGLTTYTNSLSGRQKWTETYGFRMSVQSNFYKGIGMTQNHDTEESMYKSKYFNQKVRDMIEYINNTGNPFDDSLSSGKLFNLVTGRAASDETSNFLLNVIDKGKEQMHTFMKECEQDMGRFNKPLRRNQIKTFANEKPKIKSSCLSNTITEIKMERNIISRILCIAQENKIDLVNIFSYPLTNTPHSLTHSDGSIYCNTKKGELIDLLQVKIKEEYIPPSNIGIEIINGFDLLNSINEYPHKYGKIADFILSRLCETDATEIYLIFDKFQSSTIRDVEMKKEVSKLEQFSATYKIRCPNQERTAALSKLLKHPSFKDEFVNFLLSHWASDENKYESILNGKRVFVSYESQCYLFCNEFEKKKLIPSFGTNHIEVETKMIFHVLKTPPKRNVLIKTINIEAVLIYLVYHMQFMSDIKLIWIENFKLSKTRSDIINVRQIYSNLSSALINALPAWYIFSGMSYEPSFYNKGRKSSFKVLQQHTDVQLAFGEMGLNTDVSECDAKCLEKFVCKLYNSNESDINIARANIFQKAYRMNQDSTVNFKKKGIFSLLYFICLYYCL